MLNDANCLHKVYLACGYIKTVWGRGNYCAKMQQGDGSPSHYNSNNMYVCIMFCCNDYKLLWHVLGPEAQFWMNLETNHQLNKVRLKRLKELEEELKILKRIPHKYMSDLGVLAWVKKVEIEAFMC